jgi:hypothetical protein
MLNIMVITMVCQSIHLVSPYQISSLYSPFLITLVTHIIAKSAQYWKRIVMAVPKLSISVVLGQICSMNGRSMAWRLDNDTYCTLIKWQSYHIMTYGQCNLVDSTSQPNTHSISLRRLYIIAQYSLYIAPTTLHHSPILILYRSDRLLPLVVADTARSFNDTRN